MKLRQYRRAAGITTAALALSVSLAACGNEDDESTDSTGSDTSSQSSEAPMSSDAAAEGAQAQTFGPACDQVPTSGAGSFDGMVKDPVATAASNNPLLKTLVAAVGAAGLGDTLNGLPAATVFAPFEGAFAEIPKADLDGLLAGAKKDGANSPLAKILTHHVLGEQLDPTKVVGEQETLAKDKLTIEGDESGMTVSDGTVTANVLCGNIPTANATVYVIDKVLTGVK